CQSYRRWHPHERVKFSKPPPCPPPRAGEASGGEEGGESHFLAKRRRPAMVSPAVTASSPSRIGAIGMPAGRPAEAGWPVAARSEGSALAVGSLDGAGWVVAAGAADAAASSGVLTSRTRRVG